MRVLISGAGIAGPTLAWFLSKAGARVTIVEKTHKLLPHGQNVDIQGSARFVIKKMGLTDEVKRLNTTEKGTQFIDLKGRPFAPFPLNKDSDVSMTSEYEILRGDLAAILYDATKNHSNINYLFSTTIKNVLSNKDKSVKVELSNGEVQEYDLLVAADGQWSKVRKQCFPAEDIKVRDTGMNVVYYTIPRTPADNDWWNIYVAGKSRIITTRPDPHGTIRAMFSRMPCNEEQKMAWVAASKSDRQTQEKLLYSEFSNAGWEAQRLLNEAGNAPDWYFHVIQQIRMAKWSKSRVICLGDAGYAPSPLTGMGTSLAITGAYVLAGEISKLEEGAHPGVALDAYEEKFRPFVEKMQEIPGFLPDAAHPESTWKRWLLYAFVTVVSRIVRTPWLAKKLDQNNDDDYTLPEYPKFADKSLQ